MVSAFSLWVPVLLSGLFVFVASSVIHMMLPYHRKDYRGNPGEDGVMNALGGVPAGDYLLPHAGTREVQMSEAYQEKVRGGPVAFMTVLPEGAMNSMRNQLVQWFVYCSVVAFFTAYVTGLALAPGAEYMEIFQVASTTAFMGYGLALVQRSVWYSQSWATTGRNLFDAVVYALLTGATFGWLWP